MRWGRIIAVLICLASTADANERDKEASLRFYRAGKKHYNLGEFKQAIELFRKAYAAAEHPVYLYNLAQAYRLDKQCEKAKFFYDQYLSVAPQGEYRPLAEKRLIELGTCEPPALPDKDKDRDKNDTSRTQPPPYQWPGVSFGLLSGVGQSFAGEANVPIAPATSAVVSVPVWSTSTLGIAVAGQFDLTTFAFSDPSGDGRLWLTGIGVGPELQWRPKRGRIIYLVGIGAGLRTVSGLSTGNPLLMQGSQGDTELLFALATWARANWMFTDHVGLSLGVGLTSGFATSRMEADISLLTTLSATTGVVVSF